MAKFPGYFQSLYYECTLKRKAALILNVFVVGGFFFW